MSNKLLPYHARLTPAYHKMREVYFRAFPANIKLKSVEIQELF